MAKTRMARVAQEAKLQGARGLIQRARKFRASGNKNYIEIALADELEKLLNERDAMTREYFVLQTTLEGVHRGPWTEAQVDEWIQEWKDDGGKVGVFYKASRLVGEIK